MKAVLEIELFDAGPFSTRSYRISYSTIIKFRYGWWCTENGCECKVFNIPVPYQSNGQ